MNCRGFSWQIADCSPEQVQRLCSWTANGQATVGRGTGNRGQNKFYVPSSLIKGQPRDNSWTLPPPPPPKLEGEPTDRRQTRVDEHHKTNQSQVVSQQVASRSASYKIRGDGDVDRVTWVCRRSRPGSVGFTCPSSHVFVFSLVILDSSAAAIHSKMLSSASRILFLLATILALTTATLHGRIESCSG